MADFYWVGGNGTWDTTDTTNWAASSGGAGGAGVPASADVVFFDANSGSAVVTLGETVTVSRIVATAFVGTLDFQNYEINLTATATAFGGNAGLNIAGTAVINLTANSSTGTRTISTGLVTEANSISFNVTAGTSLVQIQSNSRVKNLNFTGFTGTFTAGNATTIFGNLTLDSGMAWTSTTATHTFGGSGVQTITTNGVTIGSPITLAGNALQLQDNLTMGSTRTFTLSSGTLDLNNKSLIVGRFSSNNTNTRSILFGTSSIELTDNSATVLSMSNATGFTYTGTPDFICSYSGSTGTRTIIPTATSADSTNAVNIYVTAGTDTVTISGSARINTLDMTGFAGTLTYSSTSRYFQDLVYSSGMTLGAGAGTFVFVGGSPRTQKITTSGIVITTNINVDAPGCIVQFQDALALAPRTLTITDGTVQLKDGVTSTVGAFVTSGTSQKFLQSTVPGSQATLSQSSGTVNVSNLTIQDINATGGATWDAFVTNNNVDAGNNTGWDFFAQLGRYIYTRRKNKRILL